MISCLLVRKKKNQAIFLSNINKAANLSKYFRCVFVLQLKSVIYKIVCSKLIFMNKITANNVFMSYLLTRDQEVSIHYPCKQG